MRRRTIKHIPCFLRAWHRLEQRQNTCLWTGIKKVPPLSPPLKTKMDGTLQNCSFKNKKTSWIRWDISRCCFIVRKGTFLKYHHECHRKTNHKLVLFMMWKNLRPPKWIGHIRLQGWLWDCHMNFCLDLNHLALAEWTCDQVNIFFSVCCSKNVRWCLTNVCMCTYIYIYVGPYYTHTYTYIYIYIFIVIIHQYHENNC